MSIGFGGTLSLDSLVGNTFANNVTNGIGGTGMLAILSDDTITISGALTDGAAGALALIEAGTGTAILTSVKNTYTGETLIKGGTLQIGTAASAGSISPNSQITIEDGATLALVKVNNNIFVNNLTGVSGLGTVLLQPGLNTTISVEGKITDGAGQIAVTQNGAGTSILTNPDNTYTGATKVMEGTLQIGTTTSAGSIGFSNSVSIGGGGVLSLVNVVSNTFGNAVTNGVGGVGTLMASPAKTATLTISGALTDGSGQLAYTQNGAGTTILIDGANTYSGATTITRVTASRSAHPAPPVRSAPPAR